MWYECALEFTWRKEEGIKRNEEGIKRKEEGTREEEGRGKRNG